MHNRAPPSPIPFQSGQDRARKWAATPRSNSGYENGGGGASKTTNADAKGKGYTKGGKWGKKGKRDGWAIGRPSMFNRAQLEFAFAGLVAFRKHRDDRGNLTCRIYLRKGYAKKPKGALEQKRTKNPLFLENSL